MSDKATLVEREDVEKRTKYLGQHKTLSVVHLALVPLAIVSAGTVTLNPFLPGSTFVVFLCFTWLGSVLNLTSAILGTKVSTYRQRFITHLKTLVSVQYWLCIAGTMFPVATLASFTVALVRGLNPDEEDGTPLLDVRAVFLYMNIALSIMLGVICLLLCLNLFCHSKEMFGLENQRKRTENAISMIQLSLKEALVRGLPQCPLPPTFGQSLSGGSIYGEGPPSYDVTVSGDSGNEKSSGEGLPEAEQSISVNSV